jgi:DNA polymerase V
LAQYNVDDTLKLTTPTDDTRAVMQAVSTLLERIYQPRYQYKQAGVILSQLQSNSGMQLDLFAPQQADDRTKQKRLMHAIDSINERFGKNQIHFAVQGGESDTEDDPAGFMRAKKVE